MNLYLNIDDLKSKNEIQLYDNIRFLYAKQNTIMDGDFTKILYSTDCFTMNGLYLLFPAVIDKRPVTKATHINHIRTLIHNNPSNIILTQDFALLETALLTLYNRYHQCEKQFELSLFKQLSNRHIRVYTEQVDRANSPGASRRSLDASNASSASLTLKISGIWESHDKVGITYKIVELSSAETL